MLNGTEIKRDLLIKTSLMMSKNEMLKEYFESDEEDINLDDILGNEVREFVESKKNRFKRHEISIKLRVADHLPYEDLQIEEVLVTKSFWNYRKRNKRLQINNDRNRQYSTIGQAPSEFLNSLAQDTQEKTKGKSEHLKANLDEEALEVIPEEEIHPIQEASPETENKENDSENSPAAPETHVIALDDPPPEHLVLSDSEEQSKPKELQNEHQKTPEKSEAAPEELNEKVEVEAKPKKQSPRKYLTRMNTMTTKITRTALKKSSKENRLAFLFGKLREKSSQTRFVSKVFSQDGSSRSLEISTIFDPLSQIKNIKSIQPNPINPKDYPHFFPILTIQAPKTKKSVQNPRKSSWSFAEKADDLKIQAKSIYPKHLNIKTKRVFIGESGKEENEPFKELSISTRQGIGAQCFEKKVKLFPLAEDIKTLATWEISRENKSPNAIFLSEELTMIAIGFDRGSIEVWDYVKNAMIVEVTPSFHRNRKIILTRIFGENDNLYLLSCDTAGGLLRTRIESGFFKKVCYEMEICKGEIGFIASIELLPLELQKTFVTDIQDLKNCKGSNERILKKEDEEEFDPKTNISFQRYGVISTSMGIMVAKLSPRFRFIYSLPRPCYIDSMAFPGTAWGPCTLEVQNPKTFEHSKVVKPCLAIFWGSFVFLLNFEQITRVRLFGEVEVISQIMPSFAKLDKEKLLGGFFLCKDVLVALTESPDGEQNVVYLSQKHFYSTSFEQKSISKEELLIDFRESQKKSKLRTIPFDTGFNENSETINQANRERQRLNSSSAKNDENQLFRGFTRLSTVNFSSWASNLSSSAAPDHSSRPKTVISDNSKENQEDTGQLDPEKTLLNEELNEEIPNGHYRIPKRKIVVLPNQEIRTSLAFALAPDTQRRTFYFVFQRKLIKKTFMTFEETVEFFEKDGQFMAVMGFSAELKAQKLKFLPSLPPDFKRQIERPVNPFKTKFRSIANQFFSISDFHETVSIAEVFSLMGRKGASESSDASLWSMKGIWRMDTLNRTLSKIPDALDSNAKFNLNLLILVDFLLSVDDPEFLFMKVYQNFKQEDNLELFVTTMIPFILAHRVLRMPSEEYLEELVETLLKTQKLECAEQIIVQLLLSCDLSSLSTLKLKVLLFEQKMWSAYAYLFNNFEGDIVTPLKVLIELLVKTKTGNNERDVQKEDQNEGLLQFVVWYLGNTFERKDYRGSELPEDVFRESLLEILSTFLNQRVLDMFIVEDLEQFFEIAIKLFDPKCYEVITSIDLAAFKKYLEVASSTSESTAIVGSPEHLKNERKLSMSPTLRKRDLNSSDEAPKNEGVYEEIIKTISEALQRLKKGLKVPEHYKEVQRVSQENQKEEGIYSRFNLSCFLIRVTRKQRFQFLLPSLLGAVDLLLKNSGFLLKWRVPKEFLRPTDYTRNKIIISDGFVTQRKLEALIPTADFILEKGKIQERAVNELIALSEKNKFTRLTVFLLEKQGLYRLAFEKFLSSQEREAQEGVFDWVHRVMGELQKKASGKGDSFGKLEELSLLVVNNLNRLIPIDEDQAQKLMTKFDQKNHEGILSALRTYPEAQLKYLEAFIQEESKKKKEEEKGTELGNNSQERKQPVSENSTKLSDEQKVLFIKLLANFRPKDVKSYLKRAEFPYLECLEVIKETENKEALAFLYRKTGAPMSGLEIYIPKMVEALEDIGKDIKEGKLEGTFPNLVLKRGNGG